MEWRLLQAMSMKKPTYLFLAFLTPLAFAVGCGDGGDGQENGAVVPEPAQATAAAGDAESSVVLIGGRTLQFVPATCDIQGSRFSVSGEGTEGSQTFRVELSGDAQASSVDLEVQIEPGPEASGGVEEPEAASRVWTDAGEPADVSITDDDTIELTTEVVETTPPVENDESVEAVVTVQCG